MSLKTQRRKAERVQARMLALSKTTIINHYYLQNSLPHMHIPPYLNFNHHYPPIPQHNGAYFTSSSRSPSPIPHVEDTYCDLHNPEPLALNAPTVKPASTQPSCSLKPQQYKPATQLVSLMSLQFASAADQQAMQPLDQGVKSKSRILITKKNKNQLEIDLKNNLNSNPSPKLNPNLETNPETNPETYPETFPETNPETFSERNPELNPEPNPITHQNEIHDLSDGDVVLIEPTAKDMPSTGRQLDLLLAGIKSTTRRSKIKNKFRPEWTLAEKGHEFLFEKGELKVLANWKKYKILPNMSKFHYEKGRPLPVVNFLSNAKETLSEMFKMEPKRRQQQIVSFFQRKKLEFSFLYKNY